MCGDEIAVRHGTMGLGLVVQAQGHQHGKTRKLEGEEKGPVRLGECSGQCTKRQDACEHQRQTAEIEQQTHATSFHSELDITKIAVR
jgi:hypothetical protein